jgi:hypothetical protein
MDIIGPDRVGEDYPEDYGRKAGFSLSTEAVVKSLTCRTAHSASKTRVNALMNRPTTAQ